MSKSQETRKQERFERSKIKGSLESWRAYCEKNPGERVAFEQWMKRNPEPKILSKSSFAPSNPSFLEKTPSEKKLQKYANARTKSKPARDEWFWGLWESSGMIHEHDLKNQVIENRICPLQNKFFSYVVIITSKHSLIKENLRNERRKRDLEIFGFKVFFVKDQCEESFFSLKKDIHQYRLEYLEKQDRLKTEYLVRNKRI